MINTQASSHYKITLFLFLGIFGIVFMTSHASMSVDPPTRYYEAKSIVDHGDLEIRMDPDKVSPGIFPGVNGKLYSFYGKGQTVVFASIYWFATHVLNIHNDKIIKALISITLFPVILGLLSVCFYYLLLAFGVSSKISYWGAILVILATGIWQTSKEAQEAVQLALFNVLWVWQLRRFQLTGHIKYLTIAALAVSFGFLTRMDTAPTVLCFLIGAVYIIFQLNDKGNKQQRCSVSSRGAIVLLVCCTLPALVLHMYINWQCFNNPITGLAKVDDKILDLSSLSMGVKGLLLSPGRSLFLYNPIFILMMVGVWHFYKQYRMWCIMLMGAMVMELLLHASYPSFHGNCCWGPRYIVPHFPFLMIPVVYYANTIFKKGIDPFYIKKICIGVVVLLSIAVQVLAVSMHHTKELYTHPHVYNVGWSDKQWTMFEPESHFIPIRGKNLVKCITNMYSGNIAKWPTQENGKLSYEAQINAPTLNYLAFWPYHLTYYLPAIKPDKAISLALATTILIVGVVLSGILLIVGNRYVSTSYTARVNESLGQLRERVTAIRVCPAKELQKMSM